MTVQLGRVGVWTSARNYQGAEPGQIAEFAEEVEQLGYGTLWAGLVPADLAPAETVLGATRDLAFATGIQNVRTVPADEAVHSYHRPGEAFPYRLLPGIGAGHR